MLAMRVKISSPARLYAAAYRRIPPKYSIVQIATRTMTSESQSQPEFFFYPSHGRWLWNDEINRKIRYSPFNVEGLKSIACQVTSARQCTNIMKLGEGSFNKVFLLQFDNNKELVARIPCPVAGDLSVSTASEAATMEYVRLRYNPGSGQSEALPKFPQVLAWNSSFENPVKWPYILSEHVPGVSLHERWDSLSEGLTESELPMAVHGIVPFETNILQQAFSQHGSIYFTEDVSDELRQRSLYAEVPTDPLRIELARMFRIGPTANREWWRGAYGSVSADRGPWPDFPTMYSSAAKFQLKCLDHLERTPFTVSTAADIPLLHRMLNMCIAIAPLIVPKERSMTRPVLNHPDLSLSNCIVPPQGPTYLKSIIDWQGAVVAPFFVQSRIATGLECSDLTADISVTDSMSAKEQERFLTRREHFRRYALYVQTVATVHPERKQAWLDVPQSLPITRLLRLILRCIEDGPTELQSVLVLIQKDWHSLSDAPCPIDFSPEELKAFLIEEEKMNDYEMESDHIRDVLGCSYDGLVKPEKFEEAQRLFEELRRSWEEHNPTLPFPFFDGTPSQYLV